MDSSSKKRARESRAAIERIYITMRHLFIRGSYKPNGVSGKSLIDALLELSPEIYGSINDPEKVELDGLLYVLERLPDGIEECQFIKLVAREGYAETGYEPIVPPKRRRNCFRIDSNRMYIEMTRGRSDIYDILTHLTFLYVEADKIKSHILDGKGKVSQDWLRLEEIVGMEEKDEPFDEKKASVYLSNFLGRTIKETHEALEKFKKGNNKNSLYHIIYWMGRKSLEEHQFQYDKEINFSSKLREIVGHHIYGDAWAFKIKSFIVKHNWQNRPVHIVSANLHSFLNAVYGCAALPDLEVDSINELAVLTSQKGNEELQSTILQYAIEHGLHEIEDQSGTNLSIQIFDFEKMPQDKLPKELKASYSQENAPLIVVMDYAFGEQAFECMDELLKPHENEEDGIDLNIKSVSIIGKAGILAGDKGDIMIPTAHIFEGTADNYPLDNELNSSDFTTFEGQVFEGPMITVLGTSLQNKDVLNHFVTSTWNAVGLEMEGAHYQKAIQSAAKIRKSVATDIRVMYAYYASDNPLRTGSTLASGSLGAEGVKPTYLITKRVLNKLLSN